MRGCWYFADELGIGHRNLVAGFEHRDEQGDDWKKCKNRYEKIVNGELTNVIKLPNGQTASLPSVPPTHEDYESQMADFTYQMLQSSNLIPHGQCEGGYNCTQEEIRETIKSGYGHPIMTSSLSGGC